MRRLRARSFMQILPLLLFAAGVNLLVGCSSVDVQKKKDPKQPDLTVREADSAPEGFPWCEDGMLSLLFSMAEYQQQAIKEAAWKADRAHGGLTPLTVFLDRMPKVRVTVVPEVPPGRFLLEVRKKDVSLLTIANVHSDSLFFIDGNIFYYANYCPWGTGCRIDAYDLTTGGVIWQTDLKGIGGVRHSEYSSYVRMKVDKDVIRIAGEEEYGSYYEVIDKKTGEIIFNSCFRDGKYKVTVDKGYSAKQKAAK